MKRLKNTEIIFALIAVVILTVIFADFFLTESVSKNKTESFASFSDIPKFSSIPVSSLGERVIYTCRLDSEEEPAVQISEIKNAKGKVRAIVARVNQDNSINLELEGTEAIWEYKSVSAASGKERFGIFFDPQGANSDFDWILTVKGKGVNFSQRVRDCQEVADE